MAGATEAPLPGVIRGHNGRVAWGRTATETDQTDVYVETVNPANANEVLFEGKWEPLRVVTETIAVKGAPAETITVKFSRHGPIFFEDTGRHLPFALRSQLHERGTAEYLGGLRLDQAVSARDCLTAANFMPMPPTNLVCADADGNIAFRIAVFAPVRKGWTGRLPVPGSGAQIPNNYQRTNLQMTETSLAFSDTSKIRSFEILVIIRRLVFGIWSFTLSLAVAYAWGSRK